MASRPLSKKNMTPRTVKRTPKPVRPTPISVVEGREGRGERLSTPSPNGVRAPPLVAVRPGAASSPLFASRLPTQNALRLSSIMVGGQVGGAGQAQKGVARGRGPKKTTAAARRARQWRERRAVPVGTGAAAAAAPLCVRPRCVGGPEGRVLWWGGGDCVCMCAGVALAARERGASERGAARSVREGGAGEPRRSGLGPGRALIILLFRPTPPPFIPRRPRPQVRPRRPQPQHCYPRHSPLASCPPSHGRGHPMKAHGAATRSSPTHMHT